MGRNRKKPVEGNDIARTSAIGSRGVVEVVEERLGLHDDVCMDCDARNPRTENKCRKCGSKDLRKKRSQFFDNR